MSNIANTPVAAAPPAAAPGDSSPRAFEPVDDPIRDRTERRGDRMVGAYRDQRARVVATFTQFAHQRQLTQKWHAQDRHLDLLEHRDAAPHVHQRDLLRRGNDDSAGQRDALGYGELRVAGPR